MTIRFEKASISHITLIFSWLTEPHMMEFWDNSPEHKEDILNFIHNKQQTYFAGTTQYWVGFSDAEPYAFILSDVLKKEQTDLSETHRANMSKTGHTVSLDFGIGNKEYLGRGLGASTLLAFIRFYTDRIDVRADTFFIDPDENNRRAIHVYNKAGFTNTGHYNVTQGIFRQSNNVLMLKRV